MRDFLNDFLAFALGHSLPPGKPFSTTGTPFSRRARLTPDHAQNVTNLRSRLMALAVTQSQFADLCGVHPNTVSNWTRGVTRLNAAAELLLQLLEDHGEVRRALCVGAKAKGEPRGRPFVKGNVYRFGDRRRRVAVAGAQMARAAA